MHLIPLWLFRQGSDADKGAEGKETRLLSATRIAAETVVAKETDDGLD